MQRSGAGQGVHGELGGLPAQMGQDSGRHRDLRDNSIEKAGNLGMPLLRNVAS